MIGKDKTRLNLTISIEDKKELERIALDQNRSVSNLINFILKEYIKNHSHKK